MLTELSFSGFGNTGETLLTSITILRWVNQETRRRSKLLEHANRKEWQQQDQTGPPRNLQKMFCSEREFGEIKISTNHDRATECYPERQLLR